MATVDLRPWVRLRESVMRVSGPLRVALTQAAVMIRAYWQERFNRYSRGGGDWPPLSPATIARRRQGRPKAGRGRTVSILRDTNTLFGALDAVYAAKPGQLEEISVNGLRVGYGGPAKHPEAGSKTVAEIAEIHDQGTDRIPQRQIIVLPPEPVMVRVGNVFETGIQVEAIRLGA